MNTTTIISAATAFAICAGGALLAILISNGTAALNTTAWIVSAVFGLISAAKDLRSSLRLPPVETGPTPQLPLPKTNNQS